MGEKCPISNITRSHMNLLNEKPNHSLTVDISAYLYVDYSFNRLIDKLQKTFHLDPSN